MNWTDKPRPLMVVKSLSKLRVAKLRDRVSHAASWLSKPVRYNLGSGGMSPSDPMPDGRCDCSGFVSATIGMSRHQEFKGKPWSSHIPWIETTAVFDDAKGAQWLFVPCAEAWPGCIVVIPDRRILGIRRQGHIGIVSQDPTIAIDCASGRGDRAVGLRPVSWWTKRGGIVVCLKEDVLA